MEDLETSNFFKVLCGASVISLAVFSVFVLFGEPLLVVVLGVRPEALRIFGGVIFAIVGYNYVVKGHRATQVLRGNIDELPSEIALPFMIGAGTITQSILIGKRHTTGTAFLIVLTVIVLSFFIVMTFKFVRDKLAGTKEKVFDKYVNILSRINGLIIGAVSTDMIVSGMQKLWNGG
jgi:multiple antibiotic resistance protein